jgi:hypothetical protein
MAPFFLDLDRRPDEGFLLLEEVFHLEDQLDSGQPEPDDDEDRAADRDDSLVGFASGVLPATTLG